MARKYKRGLYQDRHALLNHLGIPKNDPETLADVSCRIKEKCVELGVPLDRNYSEYPRSTMRRLINDVAKWWNATYGKEERYLSVAVVDAMLHFLCLRYVNAVKAKARRQRQSQHDAAFNVFPGKPDDDADDDNDNGGDDSEDDDDDDDDDDEPSPSLDERDGDNHENGHPAVDAEQFTVQKAAGEGPTAEDSPRAATNTSRPEPMDPKQCGAAAQRQRPSSDRAALDVSLPPTPIENPSPLFAGQPSAAGDLTLFLPATQTTLIIPRSTTLISLVSRLAEYFHNPGSGYTLGVFLLHPSPRMVTLSSEAAWQSVLSHETLNITKCDMHPSEEEGVIVAYVSCEEQGLVLPRNAPLSWVVARVAHWFWRKGGGYRLLAILPEKGWHTVELADEETWRDIAGDKKVETLVFSSR
ncbi:hypothetical protein FN846DRAFT_337452 [Sphaerosporella brunnea]|uniref:Uncharacterized protein n=1 Tax=Sphaerosporella brunnea TaxID=1250544 RepID=A0A5J5EL63_9PEZI|nr:hypothetical protein FN846DRAFT_337452 [Sphaerosporella brunnea]